MKSFKEYISEASFKIDMPDMPAVYVDAKSAGEVKKKMRALLKKPMDVNVSRVNPAKVKKAFRLRAQGKDEDEEDKEKKSYSFPRSRPGLKDFKKGTTKVKEETDIDEISRSMTPMKDRFGSGKLSMKDFKVNMFVMTKRGEVGKIVKKGFKAPRENVLTVKMNRGNKMKEFDWRKLNLYTEPRLQGLKGPDVREALDKQDEPKVKEIIKKLKGASQAHAGQAKDLEKAVSERRGRPRKDGTSDGDLENIQMQLRKSVSLRGKKEVEFSDGKKKKVDDKVARKVLQMIDKYRQSKDKQNVVNYIAKSEKNLMNFASGKAKDSDMDPEAKRKKLLGIK